MSFKLTELSYDYNALEPYIDARTMEIHHSKHHAAYTAKFNDAVEGTALEGKSAIEIFAGISSQSAAVRNNGGGFYNHSLFWDVMNPKDKGYLSGELKDAIEAEFGSVDAFKDAFAKAAATRFGSGWAWLGVNAGGSASWVEATQTLTLAPSETFTLFARCTDPGAAHEAWIAVKTPGYADGALADPSLSALQRVVDLEQFDYEPGISDIGQGIYR